MSSAINSVNAELRPHLNWLLRLLSRGSFQPRTVPIVRKLINALGAKPALPGPLVEIHNIVGSSGSPGIKVYVVNRQVQTQVDQRGMPAVLFIHGGGYISGTAAMSVSTAQKMAERLNCVVVLPDYRVAPETRFPESMEDNYSTLAWMNREASTLGIDTSRIAVYGESAGGGHAAALAIAVRDRAEFRLAAQILIYPMLDDRTGSTKRFVFDRVAQRNCAFAGGPRPLRPARRSLMHCTARCRTSLRCCRPGSMRTTRTRFRLSPTCRRTRSIASLREALTPTSSRPSG